MAPNIASCDDKTNKSSMTWENQTGCRRGNGGSSSVSLIHQEACSHLWLESIFGRALVPDQWRLCLQAQVENTLIMGSLALYISSERRAHRSCNCSAYEKILERFLNWIIYQESIVQKNNTTSCCFWGQYIMQFKFSVHFNYHHLKSQ